MMTLRTGVLAATLMIGSAAVASAAPAVVATDLNLRAGPGTGYGVVAVLPAGATVNARNCGSGWCRVSYAGVTGFASASYLGTAMGSYAAAPPPPRIFAGPRWYGPRTHWRGRFGPGPRPHRHWRRW